MGDAGLSNWAWDTTYSQLRGKLALYGILFQNSSWLWAATLDLLYPVCANLLADVGEAALAPDKRDEVLQTSGVNLGLN